MAELLPGDQQQSVTFDPGLGVLDLNGSPIRGGSIIMNTCDFTESQRSEVRVHRRPDTFALKGRTLTLAGWRCDPAET